ncbi:aldo/keto reductase [Clavibacter michiganensis]|uniref:aldo/keto reductase n=1 Tax=Clavibacter michiganensis TaxID=28447 RepID=UPI001366358E|nr:aldo/keto reductase [Clavibacter michiganensis subsp. michiganensis]MWJ47984.1 aldo/keto reductase [Clavibacter michiganensis subsp. michiganensis]
MTTSPPSASDVMPGPQPRRRRGGSLVPRLSRPTGATSLPGGIVETTVQAAGAIVLEASAAEPGLLTGGSIPQPARRRAIGDTDLRVFPLALGGNVFGWTAGAEDASAILDRYQEAGGNFIDTADSYASGRSEHMIGSWMRERRNRDSMVVATKIGKSEDFPGLGGSRIERAVDASLSRLGTDFIDLLYFHWDDIDVPLEESLAAAGRLIASGKVRHLAASNYAAERLLHARIMGGLYDAPRFVALQTHYNLVNRAPYESAFLDVVRGQQLAVMPYFALANGFLTGKYRTRDAVREGARGARAAKYLTRRGLRVLTALDEIAEHHSTSVATIALAWLLAKPGIVAPVASASRPEQVHDLVQAAHVQLSRHDVARLDRASE